MYEIRHHTCRWIAITRETRNKRVMMQVMKKNLLSKVTPIADLNIVVFRSLRLLYLSISSPSFYTSYSTHKLFISSNKIIWKQINRNYRKPFSIPKIQAIKKCMLDIKNHDLFLLDLSLESTAVNLSLQKRSSSDI